MLTSTCSLGRLEGCVKSAGFHNQPSQRSPLLREINRHNSTIGAVIVLEFRDEVYASIDELLKQYGLVTHRAESAPELANKLVRHQAELVLLNGTQPDESAWLSSAKLRIIDADRAVWIYSPNRPSALDEWLSMAGADDVIVYGGILQDLIDSLRRRLAPRISAGGHSNRNLRNRKTA